MLVLFYFIFATSFREGFTIMNSIIESCENTVKPTLNVTSI